MTRDFDLVMFGATGFTGKLVAEYLVHAAARESLRWALAGRNRDKLEAVRASLGEAAKDVDSSSPTRSTPAACAAIARRTRVVCTTVGPYAKYGSELVAACAAAGTHYCDLTGEVRWMRADDRRAPRPRARRPARASSTRAASTRSRATSARGPRSRSIAAQFGAPAAQRDRACSASQAAGSRAARSRAMFEHGRGDAARPRRCRMLVGNPYALDPDPAQRHATAPTRRPIGWDRDADGMFVVPFVMAGEQHARRAPRATRSPAFRGATTSSIAR